MVFSSALEADLFSANAQLSAWESSHPEMWLAGWLAAAAEARGDSTVCFGWLAGQLATCPLDNNILECQFARYSASLSIFTTGRVRS